MASNTLKAVLSLPALTQAWGDLLRNTKPLSRNTVGVDGVSVNDFASNPKHFLLKLARELSSKTYSFSELKAVLIKKPNGKDRLICVPTVRDRIVQRALLNFLAEKYQSKLANLISFGFIKDRSVKDAALLACNLRLSYPWVFKTDITSFFDTIDRQVLIDLLVKVVKERSLHPLLVQAINCEARPPVSRANKRRIAQLGIRTGHGLRQGMPLSPFFSNLLLYPFDQDVIDAGIPAVRYADDLIFFGRDYEKCLRIAEFCKKKFASIRLSIPNVGVAGSKSIVYSPTEPADFLGLELSPVPHGYELRLSRKQIERIRDEMLCYGSVKELLSRKVTLRTLGIVLRAKKSGYLAAYDNCTNIVEVENELKAVERKCLLKVYRDDLKIDVAKLGSEVHTFLGLGS